MIIISQGQWNQAFSKDDEADLGDGGGNVSEDDMEDKSHIKRIKVKDDFDMILSEFTKSEQVI